MPSSPTTTRVLLVPGGGSSVQDYFPGMAESLGPYVQVVEVDAPGLDIDSNRRWLKLADHAHWLAEAVRRDGADPVVVVGHSLGGLVALRLALDDPDLVAGLLLLDPSPPVLAALLPRALLQLVATSRKAVGIAWTRPPTVARSVPLSVRIRWFFVLGGLGLASDVAAGGLAAIPTTVVSASEHAPGSAIRRAHERLSTWIPGATFEVWPDTTHSLHRERPDRLTGATLALLPRRRS